MAKQRQLEWNLSTLNDYPSFFGLSPTFYSIISALSAVLAPLYLKQRERKLIKCVLLNCRLRCIAKKIMFQPDYTFYEFNPRRTNVSAKGLHSKQPHI